MRIDLGSFSHQDVIASGVDPGAEFGAIERIDAKGEDHPLDSGFGAEEAEDDRLNNRRGVDLRSVSINKAEPAAGTIAQ